MARIHNVERWLLDELKDNLRQANESEGEATVKFTARASVFAELLTQVETLKTPRE